MRGNKVEYGLCKVVVYLLVELFGIIFGLALIISVDREEAMPSRLVDAAVVR